MKIQNWFSLDTIVNRNTFQLIYTNLKKQNQIYSKSQNLRR